MTIAELTSIQEPTSPIIINEKYRTVERIHLSDISTVYQVEDLTNGQKKALKLIKITDSNQKIIQNEIDIMRSLNGCNYTVHLLDTFVLSDENGISAQCIVTPYAASGSLFSIMNQSHIYENAAQSIIRQVLLALQAMHNIGICHRDIKPENIFVVDWKPCNPQILLGDFGLSTFLSDGETCQDRVGTNNYAAPEVHLNQPYDKSVDIWGLGITLHYILCRIFPLPDVKHKLYSKAISKKQVSIINLKRNQISEQAQSLFSAMCKINPSERISIEDALKHPWIDIDDGKTSNLVVSEIAAAIGQYEDSTPQYANGT